MKHRRHSRWPFVVWMLFGLFMAKLSKHPAVPAWLHYPVSLTVYFVTGWLLFPRDPPENPFK